MNNKKEISKFGKSLKDNAELNSRTQIDKNYSYKKNNNLEEEKGYKKISMKVRDTAPKIYIEDNYEKEEKEQPQKSKKRNNNLNKNNLIMKNVNFEKKFVPLKTPTQKNVNDNKKEERGLKYIENDNNGEEFTPKFYGNNPAVRKDNIKGKKLHMEIEENPLKSVANKICKIKIIKNKNLDNNEIVNSDLNHKEIIEFEDNN